jgi:soluble lytic murein transglycosylase
MLAAPTSCSTANKARPRASWSHLLPADQQAAAARIALRQNAGNATLMFDSLGPSDQGSPGVSSSAPPICAARPGQLRRCSPCRNFPSPPTDQAAAAVWKERRALVVSALKAGDSQGAYNAAANTGLNSGADAAEAEFYAGWIALTRLKQPEAAKHFANLAAIGASPITKGRALYWQGRAAEAQGDPIAAEAFYAEGARHITTFYGQLSGREGGANRDQARPRSPSPRPTALASMGREAYPRRADAGRHRGQRTSSAPSCCSSTTTCPMPRSPPCWSTWRAATATRTWPCAPCARRPSAASSCPSAAIRSSPPLHEGPGAAETAFVYSISRQESNFDPNARSGVGARGMMQLMPATARHRRPPAGREPIRRSPVGASYNMRLGSTYLGSMVDQFSGSYMMAAAGLQCRPRSSDPVGRPVRRPARRGTDPLDFIECIPFSETRNYVMRTLETTMVYRARLNGGTAPLTLSRDLKRGGYVYTPSVAQAYSPSAQP